MKWFLYSLILTQAFCVQRIEVVPTNEEHVGTLFTTALNRKYEELSLWEKLHYKLNEKGYTVDTTSLEKVPKKLQWYQKMVPWMRPKKEVDKFVVFNLPYFIHHRKIYNLPPDKLILFQIEPPTIVPNQYSSRTYKHFSKIYTFNDDVVDNEKFFKFYYPVLRPYRGSTQTFEERKFLCLINANKSSNHPMEIYSEREEAVRFFENYPGLFDLYGYGWEKKGYRNYKGSTPDKIATLQDYRFAICYENTKALTGYITEKIFDCFAAGCVPIYLGAPNVQSEIPPNCYIDRRDFDSYEALLSHLESIDETTFNAYLENIQEFLKSKHAQRYTEDFFVTTVCDAITNP
ncbi:MAG: glycosyltransferase family 10 [Simkaniaceae bacterium]|nr:glycosyltransferase family 10 [Simkaniaceae bacterium]